LLAGNQEFFDSPGGRSFKEADPGKFITHGMIGNGMFASDVKSIFVDGNGLFQYRGEEEFEGRRAARFDFRVPSLQHTFTVTVSGATDTVGMAGTFWADPKTYDLIRLEIDAVDIPPILRTSKIVITVDYALTRLGETQTLLPQNGQMLMVRDSGATSYDRFDFTHCRAYQAESAIRFDEPGANAPAVVSATPKTQRTPQTIPPGLAVRIALSAPLTDQAAVGDLVEGRITGDVVSKGAVIVPDGSIVHGRVRELERSADFGDFYSIGLEFTDIDASGSPLRFFADLENADPIAGFEWQMTKDKPSASQERQAQTVPTPRGAYFDPGITLDVTERLVHPDLPGVGSFFMRGEHFTIPAGFHMVWKTRAM
jgi:hypothetical protein